MLCEYSKFRIESLLQYSIRFQTSTIIQNFQILTVTDFLLIYKVVVRFSVNRLPVKLPIAGCIIHYRFTVFSMHACVHAWRVFHLSRRSYQPQTHPLAPAGRPRTCAVDGDVAGDAYTKANMCSDSGCGVSGIDVNYITVLRLPGG